MKDLNGNVIIGDIPENSKIGNGNIIINSEEFLKIINKSKDGPIAIGKGAKASNGVSIGDGAEVQNEES
jgi:hypothetical protein